MAPFKFFNGCLSISKQENVMKKLLLIAGLMMIGFSSCRDYDEQNIHSSRKMLRDIELQEDSADEVKEEYRN